MQDTPLGASLSTTKKSIKSFYLKIEIYKYTKKFVSDAEFEYFKESYMSLEIIFLNMY